MPIVTVKLGKDREQEQILATLLQIQAQLTQQGKDIKHIMSQQDDANAALKRIADATDVQSATLQQEAATLQTISNEIDTFLAGVTPGTTITPELLAGLQAQADKAEAVSASLKTQADFSAAIASKGVSNPVPLPPPPPTPPTP